MITFLCWISNKDAPFEVEVTTNAGMGMCRYRHIFCVEQKPVPMFHFHQYREDPAPV